MNDLIERLVNAIIRQEGMKPDYTNPGNLRDCPWFPILTKDGKPWIPPLVNPKPAFVRYYPDTMDTAGNVEYVEYGKGFWIPRTRAEGLAGAAHVVALHIAEGNTLTQLISIWAPPTDNNNTAAYIANVQKWAAIPDANVPLQDYMVTP